MACPPDVHCCCRLGHTDPACRVPRIHSARLVGQHRGAVTAIQPATGVDVADDRHSAPAARVLQLHAELSTGRSVPPGCRSGVPRRYGGCPVITALRVIYLILASAADSAEFE